MSRAVRGGRRPNCPQNAGRSLAQLDGAETKAQKGQGGDVKKKWWQGEKAGKWGAGVRKRGAAGGIRAMEGLGSVAVIVVGQKTGGRTADGR